MLQLRNNTDRPALRVYRPIATKRRSWFGRALPTEVVIAEGLAIAVYSDDRSAEYPTLRELLDDHGLTSRDLAIA
jgi:hypothetical protein